MTTTTEADPGTARGGRGARERILNATVELFARVVGARGRGEHGVLVDREERVEVGVAASLAEQRLRVRHRGHVTAADGGRRLRDAEAGEAGGVRGTVCGEVLIQRGHGFVHSESRASAAGAPST
jgi:hypothetical protein